MWQKNMVAGTDGNISARISPDRLLVTVRGISKGQLTPRHIVRTDLCGRVLRGKLLPSTEIRLHIAAYEERSDIGAVIHAHPPLATAFTLAGLSMLPCILPEVVFHFGSIPTAPYASPSSLEGAETVRRFIREHDVVLLDRHGCVVVGENVRDAYDKLEKLEHYASVLLTAYQLGNIRTLPREEAEHLIERRKRSGIPGKVRLLCDECGVCTKRRSAVPEGVRRLLRM